MNVSVADVDRWDPGDVREVFHAARSRAEAAFEAADGLAALPAFRSWGGDAAQAANLANEQLRKDFDAHGNEALAVARAADIAADDTEEVKTDLAKLDADVVNAGFAIDRLANLVVPGQTIQAPMLVEIALMAPYQERLDAILAHAGAVDEELARGIDMATGSEPIPDAPPMTSAEIQDALSRPLPKDPQQFHDLWEQLNRKQKNWLYQQNRWIGNTDGMPACDRDFYNRLNLADQLAQAQASRSANLADLEAVHQAVLGNPDRKLLLLDTQTGRQAHAAVAIGDPDTATDVSVTTPGLNTTVHGGLGSMTSEATNLQREALRQLRLTPGHLQDTVSTISWIGYDAPQVPGWDDITGSAAGGWDVSHDDLAKGGAQNLARFYDGLQATHQGGPARLTAIGHSYGSLTAGLALQQPGTHGVSDAVFYGSPGIEASTPAQLQMQPGHVFAMETADDPIQGVYDGKPWARAATALPPPLGPVVAGVLAGGAGDFGPNPATNPNFTHLATGPAAVPDGHGGTLNLDGAHGHSDYPRWGSNGLPRTTGYNIAAVIAGLPQNEITQN